MKAIESGLADNTCDPRLLGIVGTLAFGIVGSGVANFVLASKLRAARKELRERGEGRARYNVEEGGATVVTSSPEERRTTSEEEEKSKVAAKAATKRIKLPPPATGGRGRGRGKLAKKEEGN